MGWTNIDSILKELVVELGRLDEPKIADIICGDADIRTNIQILKGLCFLRQTDPYWFETITKLLDHVDNVLRPKRNLFIHARFLHLERKSGPFHRVSHLRTHKIKLKREQSFSIKLETEQIQRYSIRDMESFHDHLRNVWFDLMFMSWYISRRKDINGHNTSKIPKITFRQYLRGVEYTLQSIREIPRQRLPPQSQTKGFADALQKLAARNSPRRKRARG